MHTWLIHPYQLLRKQADAGTLHHGTILYGKADIGKQLLAADLARYLLCHRPNQGGVCGTCQSCSLFSAGSHPDYHVLESETSIGVDQIREAIKNLESTAHLSGAKVLIVKDSHAMTLSAANALLKTLEEPTASTFIILLTDQFNKLLPTIRSRCQKIKVSVSSRDEVDNWLQQEQLLTASELCDMYWDRPLLLQQLLLDKDNEHFSQQIPRVLLGEIDLLSFCEKQAPNTRPILEWLTHWIAKYARKELSETRVLAIHKIHKEVNTALKLVSQPGINKSLLLSKTLSNVREGL